MKDDLSNILLEISLKEYEKLKDEQTQRIGFRDNMLYVTLVAIGGLVSFAVGSPNKHAALLLVPWVCIILGWTYLVNDEKISSIGKYLRAKLNEKIRQNMDLSERVLLGWELEHRSDMRRVQRKIIQCLVDVFAFTLPGILSIAIYLYLDQPHWLLKIIGMLEVFLLVGLGFEFIVYADFKKGRE